MNSAGLLETAELEMVAANELASKVDFSQGFRVAIPQVAVTTLHFANAAVNAIMALAMVLREKPL